MFTVADEDKHQFYLQTCSGTASFLFLTSSILSIMITDEDITKIITAICNNVAGLLMLAAAYNLHKKYHLARGN